MSTALGSVKRQSRRRRLRQFIYTRNSEEASSGAVRAGKAASRTSRQSERPRTAPDWRRAILSR